MALAVGQKAPDFALKDQKGNLVKLSDYLGKQHVVLSFHPLAWTRWCAVQMLSLDTKIMEFERRDTVPLGISVDSKAGKAAWAAALELADLKILCDFDPKGEVARKYDVYREEDGFAGRVVFLVDKEGTIRWVRVYPILYGPDAMDAVEQIDAMNKGKI